MAEPASKVRRLQAGAACENCRRRRSRCDAVRPKCSNCQMRSTVCEYPGYQPSKSLDIDPVITKPPTPASSTRLRGRKSAPTRPNPTSANQQATPESLIGSLDSLTGINPIAPDNQTQQTYFGISSGFNFTTDACRKDVDSLTSSYKRPRDWSNVIQPMTGQESSGLTLSVESYFDMPERGFADSLLDAYFHRTHKLCPVLHEGDFRAEYESMWQNDNSKFQRLPWFGVLNMVFAYGCESSASIPAKSTLIVAAPYVARAKSIILAHVLMAGTLETMQALLLLCIYLESTGALEECWNLAGLLTRTAQGLGVHVNPSADKFLPIERELRKRVWAGCLGLDRSLSMKFGRPPSLGVEHLDVELPLEVDDQYIRNDTISPRQPSGTPSMISFFVSTVRLTNVISNVYTKLYLRNFDEALQPLAPTCNHILSTVLLLDGQLQSWWADVPHHLKHEPAYLDRSLVDMHSQHVALKARYLYVQLLIHRRTFLYFAQNTIGDAFLRSVAVASGRVIVDCACKMIRLLSSSDHQQHLHSIWYNAQYVFASLCILCVFERLEQDKRSLLNDQTDSTHVLECYRTGMKLLHSVDQPNNLVARFIAIIEQLRGDGINDNWSGLAEMNEIADQPQQRSSPQTTTYHPWILNRLGPMFDNYIDFSDLDTFLADFDDPGEPSH